MGSTAAFGTHPYSFVAGTDGNLWVNWWSGTAWAWTNLGCPPGIELWERIGALTVDGGRPYLFVIGNETKKDGWPDLWVNSWSGTDWAWANLGRPTKKWLGMRMGAIIVEGKRPYVFVMGGGNLWLHWWSGTAWAWTNQSKPPGVMVEAAMGAVAVDNKHPYVFVKGGDGNLWLNWWSGTAWAWTNQGRPAGVTLETAMGAIAVDNKRPYVFIKGGDGDLWLHWWSGTAWAWTNQGRPPGVTLRDSMGATAVDGGRPYVFVKGGDGKPADDNLWLNWWSGTAWAWANQGRPDGVGHFYANGAITVDGARPYVFVIGHGSNDTELWVHSWSGSAWAWALQS